MTDIVERLRNESERDDHRGAGLILRQAADEIERLRIAAQSTTLRDYLAQILNVCRDNAPESCNHRMALDFVHQLAAAALASIARKP